MKKSKRAFILAYSCVYMTLIMVLIASAVSTVYSVNVSTAKLVVQAEEKIEIDQLGECFLKCRDFKAYEYYLTYFFARQHFISGDLYSSEVVSVGYYDEKLGVPVEAFNVSDNNGLKYKIRMWKIYGVGSKPTLDAFEVSDGSYVRLYIERDPSDNKIYCHMYGSKNDNG